VHQRQPLISGPDIAAHLAGALLAALLARVLVDADTMVAAADRLAAKLLTF
jgi:hypothetical protein